MRWRSRNALPPVGQVGVCDVLRRLSFQSYAANAVNVCSDEVPILTNETTQNIVIRLSVDFLVELMKVTLCGTRLIVSWVKLHVGFFSLHCKTGSTPLSVYSETFILDKQCSNSIMATLIDRFEAVWLT